MSQTTIIENGYIYVMYNEVFNHYGDNVFKIGKSRDVIQRMNGYITSYIKPIEFKFVSQLCFDYSKAEKEVFTKLDKYRIVKNREFFQS